MLNRSHLSPESLPPCNRSEARSSFCLPTTGYRLRATDYQLLRPAFTLVEMLVVMAIIVLILVLAIPTVRVMTGSNSEQVAQNTVAAYLASARADAIGFQDIEGVMFYIDPATDRVMCTEVAQSPLMLTNDVSGMVYLDLAGGVHPGNDRDALALPPQIRLFTIKDTVLFNSGYTDPVPTRYVGYNYYPPQASGNNPLNARIGGVILFDGNGRLYTGSYGFRFQTTPSTSFSALGNLVFGTAYGASSVSGPYPSWPSTAAVPSSALDVLRGQVAFVLVDRQVFLNARDTNNNPFLDSNQGAAAYSLKANVNPADGNAAGQQPAWLDVNTTPIFVNRYNGTLIRAE